MVIISPDVTAEFITFEMSVIVTAVWKMVALNFVDNFIVYFQKGTSQKYFFLFFRHTLYFILWNIVDVSRPVYHNLFHGVGHSVFSGSKNEKHYVSMLYCTFCDRPQNTEIIISSFSFGTI